MSTPWPQLVELNLGETATVDLGDGAHTLVLLDVEHTWAPDNAIAGNPQRRTLRAAFIHLEVDGADVILVHRPHQIPVQAGGLTLYVESTKVWASACDIAAIPLSKDVRLSVQHPERAWGPEGLRFPIEQYRWRSASYNNTWSALVPYNRLYYHRGDDFGAMPDYLPVVAVLGGAVVTSPVPSTQGSNGVVIRSPEGLTARYAHMNIETIDPALVPGATVAAGQMLGRTGCTWDGRRSQWADPHLHVAFNRHRDQDEVRVSTYPFLVEAYLRDYADPVLPVAGGYAFTRVGAPVTLDAGRSVVRPGHEIASMTWICHDGTVHEEPVINKSYDRPGQYAETLVVRTVDGFEAQDVTHVRVYNRKPEWREDLAYGWAYAMPVRDVHPGVPVRLWNRLVKTRGTVTVDYGDGSPPAVIYAETTHAYTTPGLYTVTVEGRGPHDEVVMTKVPVSVTTPDDQNPPG